LATGGGGAGDGKGAMLEISAPLTDGKLTAEGRQPNGWRVISASGSYTAYALCTGAGKESAESEKELAEQPKESAAAEKAG
jgi:hypothetical protein